MAGLHDARQDRVRPTNHRVEKSLMTTVLRMLDASFRFVSNRLVYLDIRFRFVSFSYVAISCVSFDCLVWILQQIHDFSLVHKCHVCAMCAICAMCAMCALCMQYVRYVLSYVYSA